MQREKSDGGWFIPTLAVGAVLLFGVLLIIQRDDEPEIEIDDGALHPAVGTKLAGLQVEPLLDATEPVELEQLRGKVTLVNFWGPWCYYCLVEMPHLVELNNEFSTEADFRLLSISYPGQAGTSLDRLRKDSLKEMKQAGASWPVYVDPNQLTQRALVELPGMQQGFGFPTTVLLDRQGEVAGFWVGYAPGMEKNMEDTVRKTLARK